MNENEPFDLKVISNFEEFQQLNSSWNALLEQSSSDRVYMTHEWFTAWWNAFGEGKELFIIQVNTVTNIVAFVPLLIHRNYFRGIPVRSVEFIQNEDSPGCAFIIKPGYEHVLENIISYLIKDKKHLWDIMLFKNMLFEQILFNYITETLAESDRKYMITAGLRSPYLSIECAWDEYFNKMSTKSRKTIRNICNRMKRLSNIEVKEYHNIENLDAMVSITKKGWKYKERCSFINRQDREFFFHILTEVAQKKGWLSLWCIYKDNNPISYEYHLKYKKCDTALLAEFDMDYKNYSPGAFLDFEIIKSIFNSGITEYDMCGSQDEYKKKWTDATKQYRNFMVFNNSFYGRLLFFTETKLVKMIKNSRGFLLNKRR